MKDGSQGRNTPVYLLFYILFWPDTWRMLMGGVFAWVLTPGILRQDMSAAATGLLYIMMACIGWSLTEKPAGWITAALKRLVLRDL